MHLYDREFNLKVGDHVTGNSKITCGLPQGGVLSPILLAIFINDLPIINNNTDHSLLFADDLVELFATDKINVC
jgi:hypothetical protein